MVDSLLEHKVFIYETGKLREWHDAQKGDTAIHYIVQYDSAGNCTGVSHIQYGRKVGLEKYIFDDQGYLVKETEWDKRDSIVSQRSSIYDSSGRLVEDRADSRLMNSDLHTIYTYRSGRSPVAMWMYMNGQLWHKYTIQLDNIDTAGNWQQQRSTKTAIFFL